VFTKSPLSGWTDSGNKTLWLIFGKWGQFRSIRLVTHSNISAMPGNIVGNHFQEVLSVFSSYCYAYRDVKSFLFEGIFSLGTMIKSLGAKSGIPNLANGGCTVHSCPFTFKTSFYYTFKLMLQNWYLLFCSKVSFPKMLCGDMYCHDTQSICLSTDSTLSTNMLKRYAHTRWDLPRNYEYKWPMSGKRNCPNILYKWQAHSYIYFSIYCWSDHSFLQRLEPPGPFINYVIQ
jgi:hypothetical protein